MTRLILAMIALTGTVVQQPATPAAPAGNARTGQSLYMKIGCYQCHGNQGQGGTTAGVRIAPAPMLAFRALSTYVRAPRGEMPPYTAKVVSDQDLADIYAYLASIAAPPPVDRIPLLKAVP